MELKVDICLPAKANKDAAELLAEGAAAEQIFIHNVLPDLVREISALVDRMKIEAATGANILGRQGQPKEKNESHHPAVWVMVGVRAVHRVNAAVVPLVAALILACDGNAPTGTPGDITPGVPLPAGVRVALTDLGTRTYAGFSGGLFPNGSNVMPAAHASAGGQRAAAIRARDVNGTPASNGRYVLLSIGMSNTTQEFSAFMALATADAAVDRTRLALADGAAGGKTAALWISPSGAEYDRIRDQVLRPRGLSEAQVAVVWLKVANPGPTRSLPDAASDALALLAQQGQILRALKVRYPNLQLVFASSRIYAGYANTTLNPEPFAYESGFAVKWLVEAQINQMSGGTVDARTGTLDYNTAAPWVSWGPYLWADGMTARGDGLTWAAADFEADGTHPGTPGRTKVAQQLLEFLKASPQARCWFLAGLTCG